MQATRTNTGSFTIVGRRSTNQDSVYVGRLPDGRELLAVADGMGGHQGGETASKEAIETLLARLKEGRTLSDAISDANAAVHRAAQANPDLNGMGTTIVAMLRSGDRYHIANVGDSRAYRITAGAIEQITSDHSFLAEALASQQMTAEEAKRSRWRNALTRAIGTDAGVEVDIFGPFDMSEAHSVLLCSDGLHGSVSDEAIHAIVNANEDAKAIAQRLVEAAFEGGSKDNITVALANLDERPSVNGNGHGNGNGNGTAHTVAEEVRVPPVIKRSTKATQLILSPPRHEPSWFERFLTKFS